MYSALKDSLRVWGPLVCCVMVLLGGVVGCDESPPSPEAVEETAAERIDGWPGLSDFSAVLDSTGLDDRLQNGGPFTVFAPKLNDVEVEALMDNPDLLTSVLKHHIVKGEALETGELSEGQTLTTLAGSELQIGVRNDTTLLVNGVTLGARDIGATNGVIHVLNRTLLGNQDIATRIAFSSDFSTLETALETAELTSALEAEGPLTVFAPSNDAFEALDDSLDTLLMPENQDRLAEILRYHVVPGEVRAEDLTDGATRETLEGSSVTFSADRGGARDTLRVNGALIGPVNLEATNGVVHEVDAVLAPPEEGTD